MKNFYAILSILAVTLAALTATVPAEAANKADKAQKKAQAAQLKAKKKQYKETDRPQLNANIQQASRQLKQARKNVESLKKDVKNAKNELRKFTLSAARSHKALKEQKARLDEAKRKAGPNPTDKRKAQLDRMEKLYNNAVKNYNEGPRTRYQAAKNRFDTKMTDLAAAQTDSQDKKSALENATAAKLAAKQRSRRLDAPNLQQPQENPYGVLPAPRTFNAHIYGSAAASSNTAQIYGPSPLAQQNEYESTSAALGF